MTMRAALMAGALACAYVLAATLDYQDAQHDAEHYREMVCSGAWPDYRDTQPDCSDYAGGRADGYRGH